MYTSANRVSLHAIRRVSGEGCEGVVGGGGVSVKSTRHNVMLSLRFGVVGATHENEASCLSRASLGLHGGRWRLLRGDRHGPGFCPFPPVR